MNKHRFIYYLIRIMTFPFQWMPFSWIRAIGKKAGLAAFFLLTDYRKRTLSNLALAEALSLSNTEILRIGKQSFQNLAIICLEYPRLSSKKPLAPSIYCVNPKIAKDLHDQGQGVIFFCGHQSNWEVLFLEGTLRMKGVAIGKPIHNQILYRWIVSIREKYGGSLILPKNAVFQGVKALKKGAFLGIVGDQAMPLSDHLSCFLGRDARTSTAPALLAYRTNSPLFFADIQRTKTGYKITYSDPIWPDLTRPMQEEVHRLMNSLLDLLQASIKASPGEWLWQHNRWKQQTPQTIYKKFRHDAICVLLPQDPVFLEDCLSHLSTLREIYPVEFLVLFYPSSYQGGFPIQANGYYPYSEIKDLFVQDYRFKLVFNFANESKKIRRHFMSLSAFEVLGLSDLKRLASPHLEPDSNPNLSILLKRALCRPFTLWSPHAS